MLKDLTDYLDNLLDLNKFSADCSNNGLQVQGNFLVKKAVFAVDACEAVFTRAAGMHADFVFTHHGLSWNSGIKRITNTVGRRIFVLMKNDISLYAAHLPLDANDIFGHNALLADMIDLRDREPFGTYHGMKIGVQGQLPQPMTLAKIAEKYEAALPSQGEFRGIGNFGGKVNRVAIVSGGGCWQDVFDEMTQDNVEAYITGEINHECWHTALENGIPVLALGHYRSETPGVIAIMNSVKEHFQIETEFIDIPTGM